MTTNLTDFDFMQEALALAKRGIFSTSPNPCVGCVIVKNGIIIGQGFHQRAGTAHAEIHALQDAGSKAEEATAYVTLEPCAHFGRTPPCADALINAGIARVVIACTDPNPLVAGKGIEKLKAAGISVSVGICEQEVLALNEAFFHRIQTGLPFVTLKLASSMDGRTALANGESQWLTGEAARNDVHYQRLASDVIIAGTGSVIYDNARLTARYKTELSSKTPIRLIIDSKLQTPTTAAIFTSHTPVIIATSESAKSDAIYPDFVEILRLPLIEEHLDLLKLLKVLGEREINSVFIEAGAGLAGAFISQCLTNRILLYLAPTFLGADARPLAAIKPLVHLSDKISFRIENSTTIGNDCRLTLIPFH